MFVPENPKGIHKLSIFKNPWIKIYKIILRYYNSQIPVFTIPELTYPPK